MKTVYIVRAFWDDEAKVWCAEGVNFIGLATSAPTTDALVKKIPDMICDLIEANDEMDGNIPVQLMVETAMIAHRHCA